MSNPNKAPREWFAEQMHQNLSRPDNVAKPHWSTMDDMELLSRIEDEFAELVAAVADGDPSEYIPAVNN